MQTINALSSTLHARRWLEHSRQPRILHVFESACNLINEYREVLSIVTTEIGDGPFNMVIPRLQNFYPFEQVHALSTVSISPSDLIIGELTIHMTEANIWNPCPDWTALRTSRNDLISQVQQLPFTNYAESHHDLFCHNHLSTPSTQSPISSLSTALATADTSAALAITPKIAGLGPGLTPSGDDFLMGALYAVRILHPHEIASTIAERIAAVAVPLTTSLSGAWLCAAGRGEAGMLWHNFFAALLSSDPSRIQYGFDEILATGATSGADALAGFIGTLTSSWEKQKKHVIS